MTLRIQRSVKGHLVAFALIGRIRAEELPDLQRLFKVEGQDHRIVLDLREVKLVDRDVVAFLACCEANGIQIENCPAYISVSGLREKDPGGNLWFPDTRFR
jgi:hypothetical protein